MGQWSDTYRVNGAEFSVHLYTGPSPWDPSTASSQIDMFLLMDDGGNAVRAGVTEHLLNRFFKGKPLAEFTDWYEEYRIVHVVNRVIARKKSKSPWAL